MTGEGVGVRDVDDVARSLASDKIDELVGRGVPWESIKVCCSKSREGGKYAATVTLFWREPEES
jgi:hypothetical protein